MSHLHPKDHYRYQIDYRLGRRRRTDAGPVIEHLRLLNTTMSVHAIAEAADVGSSTVFHLLSEPREKVSVAVAQKILSVDPSGALPRIGPDREVSIVGARRRVEALIAIGWRHSDITAAAEGARSADMLRADQTTITRRNRDAICAAFDQMSMTPGPSDRNRERARKLGYVPPLAWDEDTIDDPTARPAVVEDGDEPDPILDEVAIQRAVEHGGVKLTADERAVAVARLASHGWSDPQIARRLGVVPETILRDRKKHGIASRWAA